MEVQTKDKRRSVDLDLKVAWLAIARMYNKKASLAEITTNIGFVLLHINEKEGTPATKIAPLMGMEARSLTRMLAKLEERGLIYRVPDEKDRRMVRIFLTKEGQTYKVLVKEVVIDFNKKISNAIPQKDMDTFFRVIDRIHEVIDEENLNGTRLPA